jgi:hypothetical protein
MSVSDFAEQRLLNLSINKTPNLGFGTRYLALYTSTPSDSGGGTEVSGFGYARSSLSFASASNRQVVNIGKTFGNASGGSWGTIGFWGLFDASSGGNLLWWGAFTNARTVNDGQTVKITQGAITLKFPAGTMTNYLAHKLLNHLTGNTQFTFSTDPYIALFTTAPDDTGGGVEVSGNNYARLQMPMRAAIVSGSGYLIDNSLGDSHPPASGGNWGTINAYGIFDISSGGNLFYYAINPNPQAVNNGDFAVWQTGNLNFTLA